MIAMSPRRRVPHTGSAVRTVPQLLVALGAFAVALGSSDAARAQDAGEARLGLGPVRVGAVDAPAPQRARSPRVRIGGTWGDPWWVLPARTVKNYPRPFPTEPALGLELSYPEGSSFGLTLPRDASPLYTYDLGPYRGIVRSPQYPAWLEAQRAAAASEEAPADVPGDAHGIHLLRAGEYRAAGRLQAEGFREGEDPRYPILLAESLFALGKYEHAELVFQHALAQDGAFDALPADVASHFPSRDVFDQKVDAMVAGEARDLLVSAWLLLFTDRADEGLDLLARRVRAADGDAVAGALYRHYLTRAFAPVAAEADAAGSDDAPDAAPDPDSAEDSEAGADADGESGSD